MKTYFSVIILHWVVLSGCSFSLPSENSHQKHFISHDVLVERLSAANSEQISNSQKDVNATCDQHLKKITCISNTDALGFDSKCSAQGVTSAMLESLLKVYSELPAFHQKVFCHLNRIQIHPRIYSIGYVSVTYSPDGFPNGGMMGLKIEMLDADNKNESISWKEQLNFGLTKLDDPNRQPTPHGPFVEENVSSELPKLYAVVVHEMNHLIDMFNSVNHTFEECTPIEGKDFLARCRYAADSFPTLSWGEETETYVKMPPEDYDYVAPPIQWANKYPLLSRLCYYWCKEVMSPSLIPATYKQLYDSPFLTGYSTSSEMEDFAESAMIWVLSQTDRPMNFVIKDGAGEVLYESDVHVKNKVMQPKLNWLKRFFNRNDLEYKLNKSSPAEAGF